MITKFEFIDKGLSFNHEGEFACLYEITDIRFRDGKLRKQISSHIEYFLDYIECSNFVYSAIQRFFPSCVNTGFKSDFILDINQLDDYFKQVNNIIGLCVFSVR